MTTDWSSMSAVKLALLAEQKRSQTTDADALAAEPIAIIGLGCRFPGGANTPEAFWDLLASSTDAITEVPADRWDVDEFFDTDGTLAGKMNTRWGGFVDGIDQFDAPYFGISPREASHMDPQQRMFMEVAVEALERAGQPIDGLAGSLTGVFVGSSMLDYGEREHAGAHDIDAYSITGNVHCIIPNRFSYTFDLRGPSVSVDTACSSSLVAVHLAAQSLRNGDSDLAVAGGVNVLLSPNPTIGLAKWNLMAPDGRCKTLDAKADGFVRSEGCGVVALKRLADAISDNDPVLAVIRGSAVNQDGRSTAMTAPNGLAQQDVMRHALRTAQVRPDQVGMMEMHGTGTVLGDPIEVEAIAEVLGQPGQDTEPLLLGAAKTNVGHLEAASGVVGLIKTVLCLTNEAVPPPVHFERLNPHISLEGTRLVVPTASEPWPRSETRRIAGVSAFGFGGTNAHVLVEEAPQLPPPPETTGLPLLLLSAQTPDGLRDTASALADHLEAEGQSSSPVTFADTAATAARRRTHHTERLGVVATNPTDAIERLRLFAAGERTPAMMEGRTDGTRRRRVAFVCSGQGNQWWGMARDLLEESPVFRSVIERCDDLLRQHVSWSLLDELTAPEAQYRLDRTEFVQPVLFAIQVGLAEVLRGWGIEPHAVVGHSVGEVAAAHIAGALSLEDAIRVIAIRGEVMADTIDTGAMASIELSVDAVAEHLGPHGEAVSIAATNAPNITVISGRADAVASVSDAVAASGVAVRPLDVTYPFHSAQMAPCADAVEGALGSITPTAPSLRLASTVTGAEVTDASLDAGYWASNVREAVRFADAIATVAELGCDTFIELGPHPVLGGAIDRTLANSDEPSSDRVITAVMRRGRAGMETIAAAVGDLHCHGVEVDLAAIWPGRHGIADLPTHRWQHRRYWADNWQPAAGPAPAALGSSPASDPGTSRNPLVGRRLRSPAIEGAVYESRPTTTALMLLDHHRVAGTALVPGTGFIEMMLGAAAETMGTPPAAVEGIDLLAALVVEDDAAPNVQVHVRDGDGGTAQVVVSSSLDGEQWTEHARARIADGSPAPADVSLASIRDRCQEQIPGRALYDTIRARTIEFGPSYLGVQEVWLGDGEALARIESPVEVLSTSEGHVIHPALLDAASHSLTVLLPDEAATYLPISIDSLNRYDDLGTEIWSHLRLRDAGAAPSAMATADVVITDAAGRVLAEMTGLRVARVDVSTVVDGADRRNPEDATGTLYDVEWRDDPTEHAPLGSGPWLIVADRGGVADGLVDLLQANGAAVDVVVPEDSFDIEALRQRVATSGATDVVHLGGLDIPASEGSQTLIEGQHRGLGGSLAVLQGATEATVWLVTRGGTSADGTPSAPEQATLSGIGAGLRAERTDARCVNVDLDPGSSAEGAAAALHQALGFPTVDVVALRDGRRLVPRLVPAEPAAASAVQGPTRLASSSYGVLDGLHDQPFERVAPGPGEIEIEVEVTGLNFRDVLVALDLYPQRSDVFGDECVGTIVRVGTGVTSVEVGDAVVALAPGAFASHVVTAADLTHRLPANLGPEDAATIPMTFLTAQYALVMLGRMGPGERVLIHAGAGGVGMAAIQIAKAAGAEVFATAGNDDKRATLRAMGVDHVFDSRSLDFADGVLAATGGQGVDLVLNSLADEFIDRSVEVVATDGRFLEIGRRDVWTDERMSATRPDIDYHVVFLGDLSVHDPAAIQSMLQELMPRFESGELRPLPRTTYESADVVEAFRLMAQARHTGKVVVRRSSVAGGTCLITGGTGGIGIEIARHLVERGTRSIALVSRRGASEETTAVVEGWRADGVDVAVFAVDVADRAALAEVVATIDAEMAPLRSVVHAAGLTDDALVADQTWSHLERALAPKLAGAASLLELTAGRELAAFVLMSAASPVIGAPGQSNYVAANAALDALAATHHSPARPVISIGWGPWAGVGMTAALDDAALQRMQRRGLQPMPTEQALRAFDAACARSRTGTSHVLAIDLDRAKLDDRPLFDELRTAGASTAPPVTTLLPQWAATVASMRPGVIAPFVIEQARKVLGLSSSTPIPMRQPLSELGLDSLMAVELRNAVGGAVGEPQPATLLFDHPTSEALVDYLVELTEQHAGELQPGGGAADDDDPVHHAGPATDLGDLAELSEAEAEALLLAELEDSVVDE